MLIKGNEIVDIAELKQSSHVLAMRTVDAIWYGRRDFGSSFDLFFADSDCLFGRILSKNT